MIDGDGIHDEVRERLVEVTTADGLILDGVVITLADKPSVRVGIQPSVSVVWIPGWSRGFLAPTPLRTGRAVARLGHTFIGANTRGTGYGEPLRDTRGWLPQPGGGVWERFSDSSLDVSAWVDCAVRLARGPVVLVGHSLGGLKVLFALTREADSRVAGLCLASPPVRPHQIDPALLARAEQFIAQGRGTEIVLWDGGVPILSAEAYADRARLDLDLFGFVAAAPAVARIRCPLLAIYGDSEPGAGAALDRIRQQARQASLVTTQLIPGADHAYAGTEDEVARLIVSWACSLPSSIL